MIRADIPTSSTVRKIQIWSVKNLDEKNFEVVFTVGQQITEGETKKNLDSTYSINIHMDDKGNLVVTKNPTMNSHASKSGYQPKPIESDGTVDAVATEEINEFLETFFKLYPSASDKELAYYVSNNALPVIQKNYVFVELVNPIYTMADNKVTAIVTVKYLDQETKVTQLSQFELILEKQDNWRIIK